MASQGASARTLFSLLSSLLAVAGLTLLALPGAAQASPSCAGERPTIAGGPIGATITGTKGNDVIRAGEGDDVINALGGNDLICAGPGDDIVNAGSGDDRVRSGSGADYSNGDDGGDDMRGQGGTDVANGGLGIDRCLFESHTDCEADLDLTVTGPETASTGGLSASIYHMSLANHGPTPAVNSRVDLAIPAAAIFVPALSDGRCSATSPSTVRCVFGSMGIDLPDAADIGLAFSACNASTEVISGGADDPGTNDHVHANNDKSVSTALSLASSCTPTAVDDAATVGHDSGANTINVLANDIGYGPPFAVGSTTNPAHGAVAITNGGANVAYTPNADYCGPDSFTYQLTPGGSQATVSITVPCPAAVDDAATTDSFDPPITIDVLANDVNPAGAGPLKVISVTQPAHGTVTIGPGGANVTYNYTGGSCAFQTDSFTYTLIGGSTATVSITLTCSGG
jgi:hypothetical protein